MTGNSDSSLSAMNSGNMLRYDLMLGLIYPAVLGSIFYTILGESWVQIRSIFGGEACEVSLAVSVKFVLAWIALGFYFCDYLYIAFTNRYRPFFFWLDLLFVFTMYGAFNAVGLDSTERPPATTLMMALYLIFMICYLAWDLSELKELKSTLKSTEIALYKQVVKWEKCSIVAILACLPVIGYFEFAWSGEVYTKSWWPGLLGGLVMAAITLRFGILTIRKRKFSGRYPLESSIKEIPNPSPQTDG